MKNLIQTLKNHPYYSISIVLGLILVLVFVFSPNDQEQTEDATNETRSVNTISVSEHSQGALGVAVPTAQGNSFVIRAESSGRVEETAKVGATVQKGTILARLDNAAQLAALTQAEGNYDAAVAGAAQSDVSVSDSEGGLIAAKQDAVSSNRNALSSWNSVLFNTVDQLFSNPHSNLPGVLIEASGKAPMLNTERVALAVVLSDWQNDTDALSETDNTTEINRALDSAINRTQRLINMVDIFVTLLPKHSPDDSITASDLASLQVEFAAARTSLNSDLTSLSSAKTALLRAEDALNKAKIGGTSGNLSAANASIKQALGSLQSARSSYAKTIVRAPFAGTISSLNIAVGDIINVGTDVAIIVPEAGEETTKSFNLPLSAIKYTPDNSYVFTVDETGTLESVSVQTGLVTANYINVTGLNGDEVIVNDVRGLKAGQRVNVLN